jgi:MarR family transcriptional regulator, organic hydroperoxide resistance regulator
MTKAEFLDQDFNLWILLAQTRALLFSAGEEELSRWGISLMQGWTIFTIKAIGDRATPAEIARWLGREPHTVSSLLSRMVSQGLVMKEKSLDKKNLVRIKLTDKGEKLYHEAIGMKPMHEIISVLNPDERTQLRSLLGKLRDRAQQNLGRRYKLPSEALR